MSELVYLHVSEQSGHRDVLVVGRPLEHVATGLVEASFVQDPVKLP